MRLRHLRPSNLLESIAKLRGLGGLALVLALSFGCEERKPDIPSERVDTSTPEGQFEWAMQKLERAVVEFQPSSVDGLRVGERRVSYEIFPPDDKRKHLSARVTIESEMVYVHEMPAKSLKEQREEQRRERARANFEQQVKSNDPLEATEVDPLEQKFLSQMEEMATESRGPRISEPVLETPELSDSKVYELAYLDSRWQLQTKPETDHERLWFEYALKP
jgi:hypothetical protein